MFDRLYKQQHAIARHENGPLAEERRCYLTYCAGQQMSPVTLEHIARNTLIVAKALRLSERPGELITRTEIVSEAHRWVTRRRRGRKVQNVRRECRKFIGHAIRWLTFLGRLQTPAAVPRPYADLATQYIDYMIGERGLTLTLATIDGPRTSLSSSIRQLSGYSATGRNPHTAAHSGIW